MKKFKRRLDTPSKKIRIEGLDLIPKNPDGTVVFGTYKIEYVWDYDGVTIRTPRILEFLPPNKRIEWRKGDIAIGGVEAIQVIAIGSQEPYHPTKYTNVDITFPNDIEAWFVDRDQDGNIVFEVQLNTTITTDDSMVQAALINDEIPEGNYSIFYSTEYEYESIIYTRTITRKLTSVKHTIQQEQLPPLYSGRWEPNRLQAINLDCHRPAAGIDPGVVGDDFPTNQEIADTIPTYILTHRDTGEEIRFETDVVYPSFPSSIPTATTLYVASFHAINQVSGSGASTGLSQADFDTFVTPASPIIRSIQYGASTFVAPPPFTEITFNISSLDDIVYQDYLSGSNPVPVYYNNGGLFPTEAQLLNGVEATYVDSDGVTQNLTVTVNRPERSSRPFDLVGFYDGNEVNLSVPREWPVTYTATAPDGTVNTAVRKVIVEDTTAPIFNKQFPTTVEKGSVWDAWSSQFSPQAFFGINHPVPSVQYGTERAGVSFVSSIGAGDFNSLEHGDTFTLTATTTDRAGNQATISQVVTCEDTISPTISFNRYLSFPTGSNPTEAQLLNGYSVEDQSAPVATIVDDSSVDYNTEGIYSATYTATDPHGNSTVSTRTVLVYGAPVVLPPSGVPVACPMTPGVPNITIGSHTNISSYTDEDWIVGLNAAQGSEDVTFKIVVDPNSVAFVPKNTDGTMDYDLDGDGYTDTGVTTYFINYEIQAPDGTPLICTSRLIEIQDTLAPSINSVPNPLVINVTPDVTTPADVLTEIRALIDVVDNVDGTNYNMAFLEGLTQSEINNGSTSVKTIRFIDLSGNESRAENITLQLVINDSDGDGIPDSRDQFPFDINYTTDIDGDGVGDDDSVVIWHHDFEDTLSYLEVRETEINTDLTLNGSAASPIYATVFSNGAQKKGVQITNNDFHIETNNLDGTPIDIKNTSINFAMSMEVTTPNGGFELEDTDLGRMIYFYSAGSSNKTPSILDIKIKKLQHNTTGDISYRFSVYTLAKNQNNSNIAASSMYSNSTNSGVAYLDLTDLSEYTVLNGNGGDELHGTESGDYGIEHFITNFDLPLDSQLHAYSIVFEPRFDTSTGHQIAIYMDGELKQLFIKSSGANYGFHQGSVSYNLYGKASTILTDYIWTTYTDIDKVVAIQNKMLNASFSTPTIFGDQDNDGLLDIQEDMLGPQFDKTNPNTDANLVVNHTDELDDFIENHVIRFATPLSTTPVIGGNAYTKSSQIDLSQDEFVRYFAGGIKWGTNLNDAQSQYGGLHIANSTTQSYTVAFWWYNNGTIGSSGGVFTDPNDGAHPGLAWNNTGFYVKRNNGYAGTSTVYGDENFGTYCSDAFTADGAQWKHFAAVLDIENSEVRIYLDAQLFDTVPDWRGAYSKVVANSFPQWTDFVMFDAKLEQSKIQQLYNRRKAAEYDLRNQYPIIVNDPTPLITGFNYESVDTDYTDTILSDGLAYTINGDQTHSSTIVHKYQLADAISATGSDGGVHEILIETISGDNIRTFTRREVTVSGPLRGFLEEQPFMPTPSGTATFSSLTWDSMIPHDEGAASVTVPFPEHGRSTNGDFTVSMWIPKTGGGNTRYGTTPFFFRVISPSGDLATVQIRHWNSLSSAGVLRGTGTGWDSVGLGNVAHLVWVVTSSDNKCRYYINGSLVSTINTTPNNMQTATEIFISNVGGNVPRPVDAVDVLGIHLPPDQVLALYNAGQGQKFLSEFSAPPIITLNGGNTLVLASVDDADPGATVTDDVDSNLVATSNWSDYINQSTQDGVYDITYSATDSHDNTTEVVKQVVFINEANYDAIEEISDYHELAFLLDNDFYLDRRKDNGYADGTYISDYHPDPVDNKWSFSTFFRFPPAQIEQDKAANWFLMDASDASDNTGWYIRFSHHWNHTGGFELHDRAVGSIISKTDFNVTSWDNDQFMHFAITCDNGTIKMYVNGVSYVTLTDKYFTPTMPTSEMYKLGNGNPRVYLDDVKIYKDLVLPEIYIDYLNSLRPAKDAAFNQAFSNLQSSYAVVTTSNIEETSDYYEHAYLLDNDFFVDQLRNNGYAQGTFSNDFIPDSIDHAWSFSAFIRFPENELNQDQEAHWKIIDASDSSDNTGWFVNFSHHWNHNGGFELKDRAVGSIISKTDFNVTSWDNDQFMHFAITCDNGTVKMYVNGTLEHQVSNSHFLPSPPTNGIYKIGDGKAKVIIDQVEIYKGTALEQTQIDGLNNLRASKDTAFNQAFSNLQSSYAVVTTSNIEETSDYYEKAILLNNDFYYEKRRSNGYAQGTFSSDFNPDSIDHAWSFSAFFRFNQQELNPDQAAGCMFIDASDSSDNTGWYIHFSHHWNHTGGFTLHDRAVGSIISKTDFSVTNWDNNTFFHLAITCDNGAVKMYLNGTLQKQVSNMYFLPTAPTNGIYKIGSGQGKVILDQIEIYKGTALDQTQIDALNALRSSKDTAFNQALANLEATYDVVTTDIISDPTLTAYETAVISNGEYIDNTKNSGYAEGTFSNDFNPDTDDHRWSYSTLFKLPPGEIDKDQAAHCKFIDVSDSSDNTGWYINFSHHWGSGGGIELHDRAVGSIINKTDFIVTNWDNDQFMHLAITCDNGTVKMYLNGNVQLTVYNSYFTPTVPTNGVYRIGEGIPKITFKNMQIYKGTALTQAEIQTIYDNRDN